MSNTDYNGWTNYETWNANLWLTNDQGNYEGWVEAACGHLYSADGEAVALSGGKIKVYAAATLAKELKDAHQESMPTLSTGVYHDLLQASLDSVNWHEIAGHLIETAVEVNS